MSRPVFGICLLLLQLVLFSTVAGQSTAFSYQGRLQQSGLAPSGSFDMEFSVFDDPVAGVQLGSTQTISAVPVVSGVFTVAIDFGSSVFSGAPRYLQIAVKQTGSSGTFTQLNPRTQLLSVPYAVKSSAADTSSFASTAGTATNAAQLGGLPANQYLRTGSGPVVGDIQFTGNLLLAPATPVSTKAGSAPPATLYAVNPAPGINNPSPANLPPAAVRGDAISTVGANIGVLGQTNGANGAGVVGLANGTEGSGVTAIHFGTSGDTSAFSGDVLSPDGTALNLNMPAGGSGYLIQAFSGKDPNSISRFSVRSDGFVNVKGTLNVQGNQQVTGNLSVTAPGAGNISANNLFVSGTKNNVVTLKDGRSILFYANESPEYWFEDFGTVRLKNGRAVVKIDATFSEATNTDLDYKVFLTANGNTRGLYVVRKNASTFEVRENRRGRSNVSFDYRIVAKRRGYENLRFGPVKN